MTSKRSVLVTGGTGSLGRAVVARYLEADCSVVVPWISQKEADGLRHAHPDAPGLVLVEGSVTDPEGAQAVVSAAREAGALDTLVLLVGGFAMGLVEETDPDTWERMVALNATSVFQVVREALPVLKDNGGGRIVTVAAEPALDRGAEKMGAYAATKAAVVSLTRTLAREGGGHGITANAVAPRIIDTPANRRSMPDADTSTWLKPSEIADVIFFLTGAEGEIVNGSVLTLNRG